MLKWLYFNSPTVQALCAVLGTLGLAWYAIETYLIRKAALAQSAASRRPFFNMVGGEVNPALLQQIFYLVNSGAGIALNVEWDYRIDSPMQVPQKLGAIAPTGRRTVRFGIHPVSQAQIVQLRGLSLTYTDTAGQHYWTELVCDEIDQGVMRVLVLTGEGAKRKS